MATRHLYHVEDISATLLVAIQQNQRSIAREAAAELIASEESTLLFRLLTLAWCLDEPDSPYQSQRARAFEEGDSEALLGSLLQNGYDLPEQEDLLEVGKPMKGLLKGIPVQGTLKGWTKGQVQTLWNALTSAMSKGQWRRAAHLLCPHVQSNATQVALWMRTLGVPESFANLVKTTVYLPLAHRMVRHGLASVCAMALLMPSPVRCIIPTASGRTLTLSATALSVWACEARPITDLQGAPVWITEEPTAYWVSLLERCKGTKDLIFEDEEGEESLYSQGFPMDIPDEWSSEERRKSHGLSFLTTKAPNHWRFAFDACWI